jgi:curved DNA-binding protein CbpA
MWIIVSLLLMLLTIVTAKKLPQASSTLLNMHKQYVSQPPHDPTLYKMLQVSPNATLAQITKSYRNLSRKYHPDKISDAEEKLQSIRQAYEVLKDDNTRLPYHKYGLVETSMAVVLLMGPGKILKHPMVDDPLQNELLQLMGYDTLAATNTPEQQQSPRYQHRQRVLLIAARLLEKIRPLVEGTVDERLISHMVAEECDRLKRLPMGAQILRCVGRAYRHTGQHYLERHHSTKKVSTDASLKVRHHWRQAKNLWTAAFASGRVALTEKKYSQQAKKSQSNKKAPPALEYERLGELIEEDDDHELHMQSDEEINETERLKAQRAMLQSLRVEALWKISKIDLDNTIREACRMILDGEYFFFPSHQSSRPYEWNNEADDGWVSHSGSTVDATEARVRAAAALTLIGNVMVRCSKEGTAWKE